MKDKTNLKYIIIITVLVIILGIFWFLIISNNRSSSEKTNNTSNTSYNGVKEITTNEKISEGEYASTNSDENAILVSGDIDVTLSSISVSKTGDSDGGDNTSFYGTNSAILAKDGANLTIKNAIITTDANGANGVFSYGGSATTNNSNSDGTTINISDSTITTSKNNSGGIMTTGGGIMNATNLTINTSGISSAAIRSDRGGGTVTVNKGTYKTTGQGSPTIYSTADITVKNAELVATASEGVVIEGKNSVTLENVTLTDTNNTLNGQSTTYKNIFLYQSMSGDADEWTAKFTAKNSKIITNKWDTIYVTNTTAEILLENNEIVNNDWDFLRIESAAWWKTNENGWDVSLNLVNQNIKWDIIVDNISSLNMEISEWSSYEWSINTDNQSQNISVNLDSNSSWTLTANSYISEITSSDESFLNINLNWFSLYIWEEEYTSIDQIPVKEIETTEISETTENIPQLWANPTTTSTTTYIIWWLGIIIAFIISGIIIKKYIKKA